MEKSILGEIPSDRPVVFISYSWDSEDHQDWVAKLAEDLTDAGIYVLFDQYVEDGTILPAFMDFGIERADKVIVIGTETYKQNHITLIPELLLKVVLYELRCFKI